MFTFDSTPDRVVFYYIFMPILRHEIDEFVLTWNAHRIRTRSDLANSVGGIPNRLYYTPKDGIQNCGRIANKEELERHAREFSDFGKLFSTLSLSDIQQFIVPINAEYDIYEEWLRT